MLLPLSIVFFYYMKCDSMVVLQIVYSLADGSLSFQLLTVMNKATINICIEVSLWTYAFISLG